MRPRDAGTTRRSRVGACSAGRNYAQEISGYENAFHRWAAVIEICSASEHRTRIQTNYLSLVHVLRIDCFIAQCFAERPQGRGDKILHGDRYSGIVSTVLDQRLKGGPHLQRLFGETVVIYFTIASQARNGSKYT